MTATEALVIDIDGVLTVGWEALDGAVAAFRALDEQGVPRCLATNTTTRTRDEVARLLNEAGFAVEVGDIVTAPVATADHLRERHAGKRCFVLSSGDISGDLTGIDVVTALEPAEVVVLGGAGLVYTHEQLNHAFNLLLDGAAFVAMHRNLYWRTARGLELDTGAYATALATASGREPEVVGKPSPAFFRTALGVIGHRQTPERVAMVGDDIDNDVLGAKAVGMRGVLVRTGKYRADAVAAAAGEPDEVIDSFADVLDLLG